MCIHIRRGYRRYMGSMFSSDEIFFKRACDLDHLIMWSIDSFLIFFWLYLQVTSWSSEEAEEGIDRSHQWSRRPKQLRRWFREASTTFILHRWDFSEFFSRHHHGPTSSSQCNGGLHRRRETRVLRTRTETAEQFQFYRDLVQWWFRTAVDNLRAHSETRPLRSTTSSDGKRRWVSIDDYHLDGRDIFSSLPRVRVSLSFSAVTRQRFRL